MADAVNDESRLIARCRKGDTDSYGELVRLHQDRVFNVLFRLLGDYEEARDAAQEVFLKAYRGLRRFRSDSTFSTWVYRIAVNTAYSIGRKRRARPGAFSLDPLGDGRDEGGPAAEDADPVGRAVDAEEVEMAQEALLRLDEAQRRLLVLHELEGCSYAELAEILDVPRGTVKSKLHRARSALRGMVARLRASRACGGPEDVGEAR